MSRIPTAQPSRANRPAVARPMPRGDPAPVTTAVRAAGRTGSEVAEVAEVMVLPFRRGHRRHPLVARDSQERNPCGSSSHRADDRNGPHHLVTARLSPGEHEAVSYTH